MDRTELSAAISEEVQHWVLGTVRFYAAVADRLGVHVTDLHAVAALTGGPLTAGELAAHMGLSTGAVTRLIDRLDKAGYARRLADASDRRRVVVEVVPEAVTGIGELFAGMAAHIEAVTRTYPDDQLQLLLGFIRDGARVAADETAKLREPDTASAPSAETEHRP